MLLIGVNEEGNWLRSRWQLTYRVGWEHICKGVHAAYDYYDQPEVLVGQAVKPIREKDDILRLDEFFSMTIRGMSKILGVPVMITFLNQTDQVDVTVARMKEEFRTADYRQFNLSMCQYLDSIELAMYR
jgi:hypothetical protein